MGSAARAGAAHLGAVASSLRRWPKFASGQEISVADPGADSFILAASFVWWANGRQLGVTLCCGAIATWQHASLYSIF